jgi:hypothetical protein
VVWSALAQNDVTFQVRMNIKMREGTFLPGSGDRVRVAGDFNSWSTTADTLTDPNNDSIYTITKSLPTGGITYKFFKTLRGGLDWEGDPNRTYTVQAGTQSIDPVYFDRDSVYTPPATADVTFRVNMRVKMVEGTFLPGSGDRVRVAGSFNDWGNSPDTLYDVLPTDSIYQKTITLTQGQALQYKFLKTPRGGDWEDGSNREFTVPSTNTVLPAVYFNNDSLISVPTSGNIVWRVDMRALQNIGWFNPGANDSLQVRGSFSAWDNTAPRLAFNPVSGLYQLTRAYTGQTFDDFFYKYFIIMDSASAEARFPGFGGNRDGVQYDHTYERGDGNRVLNLGTGGNMSAPSYYFSSVHRFATMNNTTDTCLVTLKVNMGPATREADPFLYASDTVYLDWEDFMWQFAQVGNQGTFPGSIRMTRQGPTDSVYTVTFRVKGRAHSGLMYRYRYVHVAGPGLAEGGGLGVQNPYRTRYIGQTGNNTFPATYTAPVDNWQRLAPMPAQTPPFGITDVGMPGMGIPEAYALNQNYPNPFNPETRITYSIPENAKVTLKVFNLLGQEVATLVNQDQTRGNYVALFEANKLATGVYFYRLEAGKFAETKKMLLMK